MKFLPRSVRLFLLPVALILGLFSLAGERPPSALNAPYALSFKKAADIPGVSEAKLARALLRHPPVLGSRVTFDGRAIFPFPRKAETGAIGLTMAQEVPVQDPSGKAIHVAQVIGYNDARSLLGFLEDVK